MKTCVVGAVKAQSLILYIVPDSGFIPGWKEGDADSGLILAWNFQLARPYLWSESFPNPESGLIPASDRESPRAIPNRILKGPKFNALI